METKRETVGNHSMAGLESCFVGLFNGVTMVCVPEHDAIKYMECIEKYEVREDGGEGLILSYARAFEFYCFLSGTNRKHSSITIIPHAK